MKATITTTITTEIDLDTFTPTHAVDIDSDLDLGTEVILAAVKGGCQATLNELEDNSKVKVYREVKP